MPRVTAPALICALFCIAGVSTHRDGLCRENRSVIVGLVLLFKLSVQQVVPVFLTELHIFH